MANRSYTQTSGFQGERAAQGRWQWVWWNPRLLMDWKICHNPVCKPQSLGSGKEIFCFGLPRVGLLVGEYLNYLSYLFRYDCYIINCTYLTCPVSYVLRYVCTLDTITSMKTRSPSISSKAFLKPFIISASNPCPTSSPATDLFSVT